ncbi:MAG: GntR family transcriptional regulator [Candidatus Atribacteria bacterium]|nr:GntR family transcriptional regulator [Candidatus Atribacteria bacterium]
MIIKESLVEKTKKSILAYIFKENIARNEKIPSIEQLASLFSVGRSTVREAIKGLEQIQILEMVQGKGTYLSVDPSSLWNDISQLRSMTEMAELSGINLINIKIEKEDIKADDYLAEKLEVKIGAPLVVLKRVRGLTGEPIVYLEDVLPQELTEGFTKEDWEGSLFNALKKNGILVSYSRAKIIPYIPDDTFIKKVGLEKVVPILLLQHIHYNAKSRVIAFSSDYYHSEFFHFEILRKRI